MEIFNIHLFEFLLIAGLALVVFGPERLPEVGRFVGKQVARFLAWQQQSPELKMIHDVRAEFEQEIASLRDELVRTRRQLDISQDVSQNLNSIRDELRPMLNLRDQPGLTGAGATPPEPVAPSAHPFEGGRPAGASSEALEEAPLTASSSAASPSAGEAAPLPDPALSAAEPPAPATLEGTVQAAVRPNRLATTEPTTVLDRPDERISYLESRRRSLHDPPAYDEPPVALNGRGAQPPVAEAAETLQERLERLSAEVRALVGALQARGLLGDDWQPRATSDEQESLSR